MCGYLVEEGEVRAVSGSEEEEERRRREEGGYLVEQGEVWAVPGSEEGLQVLLERRRRRPRKVRLKQIGETNPNGKSKKQIRLRNFGPAP